MNISFFGLQEIILRNFNCFPIDAEGLNENDPNYSFENRKKSTSKNFMSPTISAAAKANFPRKKILADRNEASGSILSDIHFSKTPEDAKSSSADEGINGSDGPLRRTTPLAYRASVSEEDDRISAPDPSSRPYDPLTNYLSPRPKFLRYNPDRRREIFLLKENEIKDGNDRLGVSRNVSFESQNAGDKDSARDASSPGGSVKEDGEEIVEGEEEIEEERGVSLKGVLNALFVFAILIFSISYISSMNSPTPSPAVEAVEVLKDGYLKIQSHVFGAASVNGLGDELTRTVMGLQNGYLKIQSLMFGDTLVKTSEIESELMEENRTEADEEAIDGEVVGEENGGVAEEEEENKDVCDQDMEKTREVSDQIAENMEFQEVVTAEKFEAFQDDLIKTPEPEPTVPGVSENDAMNTDSISKDEEEEDDGNEEVVAEGVEGVEDTANKENTNIGMANLETEVKLKEEEEVIEIETTETESIPKVVIWASLFSIIVVPLVLGFHIKRRRTSKRDSSMAVNQCSESVVAEKSSVAVVLPPNEGVVYIEKVESYADHHSMEEASQEYSQSRAPTVELLGEYVVGEISSTPKTSSIKSKMRLEGEESNHYSVSQERRETRSVPIRSQAETLSALSTMDSPSYGSFTAEKRSGRKKEVSRRGLHFEFFLVQIITGHKLLSFTLC